MTNRRVLPQRRPCETFVIPFWSDKFHVTIGYYDHAQTDPGEVFVAGSKRGSMVDAVTRDGAILLSFALQYGIPIGAIEDALTKNVDGTPATVIGAIAAELAKQEKG